MSINKRLKELSKTMDLKPVEIARLTGIKPSTLNPIVNGEVLPRADTIGLLLTFFKNVNARWLLTGEGEMLVKKESTYRENVLEAATKTNEEEIQYSTTNEAFNSLMAVYRKLVELETENKLLRERLNEYLK